MAVVFDAVGTLIFPRPGVAAVYAAQGLRFGSRLAEAEVEGRFRRAFAAEEEADRGALGSRTDEPRERRRWQAIVASVFDDVADQAGLFEALWEHFARPTSWGLYADVAPTWQALRARGLRLAVASNFDSRLLAICQGQPALAACDGVFVSSALGHRKPSREFFAAVARGLACQPSQLVMVGDDFAHDCLAPREVGWQALFLDRGQRIVPTAQEHEQDATTATISELTALVGLLSA